MKSRYERNNQSIRSPHMLIWVAGAGVIVILYLLISTSHLYSSTNIWKRKFQDHYKKPVNKSKEKSKLKDSLTKLNLRNDPHGYKLLFTPSNIPDDVEAKMIAELYPNIPIQYWMKVQNEQEQMYFQNSSCALFPDIFKLDIHNTYWQTINMSNRTTIQVYSAYYDKRQISGKVVRILSMVNKTNINFPGNQTIHCQLWFEGENEPVIAPMDIPEYMWIEYWHSHQDGTFGPFLLACSIPPTHQSKIPQIVSLVENPCDIATNMLRVVYDEPTERKEFSVCVKGLDFLQVDLSFRLVEWIELVFLMGVDKIYFYNLEAHPRMKRVLDYYIKLGKIDVRDITLPRGNPSIPFLQHLFLLNNNLIQCLDEIIPYNDCFYRNLYSHDYVALLDIDEIIMPLKDNNWHDLIQRVKNNSKPDVRYNAFSSQHIYFLDRMDKETPHKDIPPYMHILQHVYRAQNFTPWDFYIKTIFSTNETLTCHNHWPISVANGSKTHSFAYGDARMQHYRKDCSWDVNCTDFDTNPVKDTRMWDFKSYLIPKVNEVIDKIGLLDKQEDDDPMDANTIT